MTNVGNHTTAEGLRLAGAAVEREINGVPKLVIDGATSYSIDLSELDDIDQEIPLASLNDGDGVAAGAFLITDTNGQSAGVVVNSAVTTVSDVIDAINATNIGVEARINDAGTGILLFDTAGGTGTFKVAELAGGTTAADLGLDATVTTQTIDGEERKAINATGRFSQSAAQTGLGALAAKINSLQAGVTASTLHDGTGYRLMLTGERTGAGHELLVDGEAAGLNFNEIEAARDAVLEIGGQNGGSGLLVRSSDNTFDDVLPGVELNVLATSIQSVKVDVAKAQTQLTGAIEDFVDAFNSVRTNLDEAMSYDAETQTTGILFGRRRRYAWSQT